MEYKTKRPCSSCPFSTSPSAIKLERERAEGIGGMILSPTGGAFVCHKTSGTVKESHCAGAIIFALENESMPQMMRISARLGTFDPGEPLKNNTPGTIVEDWEDMVLRKESE